MTPPDLHPGPHRAVLACACGRVLDAPDMVRIPPRQVGGAGSSPAVWRIECRGCAAKVAPVVSRWTPRRWSE